MEKVISNQPRTRPQTRESSKPTSLPSVTPRSTRGRPLPVKSVHNAAQAFRNFSLSRFPQAVRPENYVHPKQVKQAHATQALQRQLLKKQVSEASPIPEVSTGTTLGLTQAAVKTLFPTYDQTAGTIPMTDVLAVLRQRMTSTEFYTRGAPPLVQSAQQSQVQARVHALIQSITQGAAK